MYGIKTVTVSRGNKNERRGRMKKSTLYVNGRIYTMDPDNTVYEAMAVEDGRIVRLGTTKELMEEMAPDQEL